MTGVEIAFRIAVFLPSPVFGSFLTVLIHRVPGRGVGSAPVAVPLVRNRPGDDNIPVVSGWRSEGGATAAGASRPCTR
jgi:prepilin signal peptidase PulO-like enzyme (type II secretory pathway)